MNWNDIPSLPALRAFEAAARCLNFSKAARELNVTPAAIAQHVRSLEAEFSENLIYRQGRGVALTPAGADLAESLRTGFQEIADGVDRLRATREQRPLKITATPAFASGWLMPRIGQFWKKYPDISIEINASTELVDMVRDGYDLAIRFGDGNWSGVVCEPLTSGEFWVVAHPDLIAGRQVNCLADVADLPWLLEEAMFELLSIVEREGIDFEKVSVTTLHNNSLVISGAMSGLGLAVQAKSLVQTAIANGELKKICEINQPGWGYYLVTIAGRDPKGLRKLMSWLRKAVAVSDQESPHAKSAN